MPPINQSARERLMVNVKHHAQHTPVTSREVRERVCVRYEAFAFMHSMTPTRPPHPDLWNVYVVCVCACVMNMECVP